MLPTHFQCYFLSLIFGYVCVFHAIGFAQTGNLHLEITKFRNSKGKILISLFKNSVGFPSESQKAFQTACLSLSAPLKYSFSNLPIGKYAVAILHDENENNSMDTNWFGVPTEGYGVSNNVVGFWRAPHFDEAAFEIKDGSKQIEIQVFY